MSNKVRMQMQLSDGSIVPFEGETLPNGMRGGLVAVGNTVNTTTSGWFPQGTTEKSRYIKNVPNYTNHATAGVVDIAEVVTLSFPVGGKVTALLVSPRGGASFIGVYITVNPTDAGEALNELKTDTSVSKRRIFVPKDTQRLIPYSAEITSAYMTALDNDATPNNEIEVEPF